MATRSPTLNHSFWGPFANAAALPLADPRLQAGDTAYATAEANLYVYDGAAWQAVGAGVTSVAASSPLASSGGATPTISLSGIVPVANGGTALSAVPTNGQLLIGNGAGYTLASLTAGSGVSITPGAGSIIISAGATAQNIVLSATATDATPAFVGTVYFAAAATLSGLSVAYIGGSLVSDSTTLTLAPAGGGSPVATWTRSGTLGNQALTSGGTISIAGWYDILLTPGASGTAFARGLYLV